MKKYLLIPVFLVGIVAFLAFQRANTQTIPAETKPADNEPVMVTVKRVADSRTIVLENTFPATVVAEQEVTLTAKTSGTVVAANFEVGDRIGAGRLIARIDDTGSSLPVSDSGLKSSQVWQLENAKEQADEARDLARETYKDQKTDANKTAKEIAELQYDSAKLNLKSAVDSHSVIAPVAGAVIEKNVSVGDSIAAGQPVLKLSQTDKINVQFFVDSREKDTFKIGQVVWVVDNRGERIKATVRSIAPQADPTTKRFAIKAALEKKDGLAIGNVVSVSGTSRQSADQAGTVLVPLSALTVGQNENYLFVVEEGKAKKVAVEVVEITGEVAQVRISVGEDALVVVKGNKLIHEGEAVNAQQE